MGQGHTRLPEPPGRGRQRRCAQGGPARPSLGKPTTWERRPRRGDAGTGAAGAVAAGGAPGTSPGPRGAKGKPRPGSASPGQAALGCPSPSPVTKSLRLQSPLPVPVRGQKMERPSWPLFSEEVRHLCPQPLPSCPRVPFLSSTCPALPCCPGLSQKLLSLEPGRPSRTSLGTPFPPSAGASSRAVHSLPPEGRLPASPGPGQSAHSVHTQTHNTPAFTVFL